MVKIEEKSLEEKARETKHKNLKNLADIARDVFKENPAYRIREHVSLGSIGVFARIGTDPFHSFPAMFVYSRQNKVLVTREQYFQDALRLAETYEAQTCQEFTLRKEY